VTGSLRQLPDEAVVDLQTARRAGLRAAALQQALHFLGIGGFYVLLVAFFSAATPLFLGYSNAVIILSNVSVIGIVAIGQAIVIIAGGFDLSVGGTVPLAAVIYMLLVNRAIEVAEAMAVTVGAGVVVGAVNGLVITRIGINPLVTTLATLSIIVGIAFILSGGTATALHNPRAGILAETPIANVPYYVWTFLLLSAAAFLMLRYTVLGRMIYAIGGNREASRLAGMRVDVITVAVYMIAGGLAAFAGIVIATQLLIGSPTLGSDSGLTSITAVILGGAALTGGVGGIPGTLLGVLVLGTMANGMALLHVPAYYQQIANGLVLLLAVGFGRLRALFGGEAW
jgi:ribose transport system permease protein